MRLVHTAGTALSFLNDFSSLSVIQRFLFLLLLLLSWPTYSISSQTLNHFLMGGLSAASRLWIFHLHVQCFFFLPPLFSPNYLLFYASFSLFTLFTFEYFVSPPPPPPPCDGFILLFRDIGWENHHQALLEMKQLSGFFRQTHRRRCTPVLMCVFEHDIFWILKV